MGHTANKVLVYAKPFQLFDAGCQHNAGFVRRTVFKAVHPLHCFRIRNTGYHPIDRICWHDCNLAVGQAVRQFGIS